MASPMLSGAGLVLLEPVMELETEVPEEFFGAVTGYFARKRGMVTSSRTENGLSVIVAEVPLAERFEFSKDLRSMTQGNETFTMQPLAYQPTPAHVQQSVLAD